MQTLDVHTFRPKSPVEKPQPASFQVPEAVFPEAEKVPWYANEQYFVSLVLGSLLVNAKLLPCVTVPVTSHGV
jgi:hypothetical protein